MTHYEGQNLPTQDKGLDTRRSFFKKAFALGGGAALSTLAGFAVPGLASAHQKSLRQAKQTTYLAPLYRLYNSHSGDHFYTLDRNEADSAVKNAGYSDEGIACYALAQGFSGATAPLYRLYNSHNGDHFYTINKDEADKAAHNGYTMEGVACNVLAKKTVPFALALYRLYNSHNGDHFYTTDSKERNKAAKNGYTKEGIACYVF